MSVVSGFAQDRFTAWPLVFAVLSAIVLMFALMAFGVLGVVTLPIIVIVFALTLLRDILRFRFKRVACEVVGAIIFFNALFVIVGWGEDIHFFMARPFYLARVASLVPDRYGHKTTTWLWDGSLNTDVRIFYDDSSNLESLPRSEDDGSCKITRRALGGHFQSSNMICYQ